MIGTAMAIGIATAAKIGTDLIGGKIASKASKDAAKLQTAAVDRASGILDTTFSPYVNKGREAIGTLGRLTAAPAGSRYAAADPTLPRQAPPMAGGRQAPPGAPNVGQARPRMSLGGMAPGPSGQRSGGGGGVPPGMVLLEAPDGSGVRPVPEREAERFISMGARRVG